MENLVGTMARRAEERLGAAGPTRHVDSSARRRVGTPLRAWAVHLESGEPGSAVQRRQVPSLPPKSSHRRPKLKESEANPTPTLPPLALPFHTPHTLPSLLSVLFVAPLSSSPFLWFK